MGYNDRHKGYNCYSPSNNRFYVSRHVVFNESSLPYKNFNDPFDTAIGIQPITFREFDSWSTPSCEHSNHFTQPEKGAPLSIPNA